MPDYKKMTVESLRELARKVLGPGHSKLKKAELVRALEEAGRKAAPARGAGTRARAAGTRAVEATGKATGKAVEVAKQAGTTMRFGGSDAGVCERRPTSTRKTCQSRQCVRAW